MTNLWDEAYRDHAEEFDTQQRTAAKVAVAKWWPFLAEAGSEREFGHRLALVKKDLVAAMDEAQVTSARFHEETLASLAEDFRLLASERKTAAESGWTGMDAIDEAGLNAGPERCSQGNPACNWGWADKDGQQVYRCSTHGTEQVKSHTTEGSRKTASDGFDLAQQLVDQVNALPNPTYHWGIDRGRAYARVWHAYDTSGHNKSVYCFVDRDGIVWYPAGWKGPTKNHPRGNLNTPEGMQAMVESAGRYPYGGGLTLSSRQHTAASWAFVQGYQDAKNPRSEQTNPFMYGTGSWEEYRAGRASFRAGDPEPVEEIEDEGFVLNDDDDPNLIFASKGWPEMPKEAKGWGWSFSEDEISDILNESLPDREPTEGPHKEPARKGPAERKEPAKRASRDYGAYGEMSEDERDRMIEWAADEGIDIRDPNLEEMYASYVSDEQERFAEDRMGEWGYAWASRGERR